MDYEKLIRELVDKKAEQDNQIDLHAYENGIRALAEALSIANVSGCDLLAKARQMRLEQQRKIDSYTEYYNTYEIGTLNGIDGIVKLIEQHYR